MNNMKNTKYDYNIFARGKKKVHRRILRDAAKRENVSEGEIVRRAIEAYDELMQTRVSSGWHAEP